MIRRHDTISRANRSDKKITFRLSRAGQSPTKIAFHPLCHPSPEASTLDYPANWVFIFPLTVLVAPPPATCLKWRPAVRLQRARGVHYRKSPSFSIIIIISNILENFYIFATAILVKIPSNYYITYCAANGVKEKWELRKEGGSDRNTAVSKDLFTSPRRSPAISQGFG